MSVPVILTIFVLGWASQGFTLFDIGRYSFPLILFASIPFCLKWKSEHAGFLTLPILSSVFTLLVAVLLEVQFSHIFSQAVLQVLAIIFAGGAASIDWRKHLKALTTIVAAVGVPIVVYGGYQMVARYAHLPLAFLPITNKQYYIDGGLQRDWDKDGVTRASSVFSEPSELGFFCLWLLALGLAHKSGRLRMVCLGLGIAGILFSQSLSAVLGGVVLFAVYLLSHPFNKQMVRQIGIGLFAAAAAIALMKPLVPEAYDRLSERVTLAAKFDERADSGRVDHLPAIEKTIEDSLLWGHGISSLAAATSSGSDATTINYAMVLMERGAIGAVLFFIPWFTYTVRAWRMPVDYPGRSIALLIMVATLYSYCSFSLTYFLPFWLAFAIAASIVNSYRLESMEWVVENAPWAGGNEAAGAGMDSSRAYI